MGRSTAWATRRTGGIRISEDQRRSPVSSGFVAMQVVLREELPSELLLRRFPGARSQVLGESGVFVGRLRDAARGFALEGSTFSLEEKEDPRDGSKTEKIEERPVCSADDRHSESQRLAVPEVH